MNKESQICSSAIVCYYGGSLFVLWLLLLLCEGENWIVCNAILHVCARLTLLFLVRSHHNYALYVYVCVCMSLNATNSSHTATTQHDDRPPVRPFSIQDPRGRSRSSLKKRYRWYCDIIITTTTTARRPSKSAKRRRESKWAVQFLGFTFSFSFP